jgi:hypothetical protein
LPIAITRYNIKMNQWKRMSPIVGRLLKSTTSMHFLVPFLSVHVFMLLIGTTFWLVFQVLMKTTEWPNWMEYLESILTVLPVSITAGLVGIATAHIMRNAGPSRFRWLWVSFLSAQVGCCVGIQSLLLFEDLGQLSSSSLSFDFAPIYSVSTAVIWLCTVTAVQFRKYAENCRYPFILHP